MEHQHDHPAMEAGMMRKHYLMLALNMLISTAIMYLVMFEMIYSGAEFFHNLNMFYMAITMAAPMGILMLLMMGSMYPNRRVNMFLYAAFAALFVLGLLGVRSQALIGDRQFLRSMIPHHSGAVLMCEKASIRDPQIKTLCEQIIVSQKKEIAQMKDMLERR